MKISGQPGGGKVRMGSGSDPRPGVSGSTGTTYGQKFNANPFTAGGNMEVRNPDTKSGGMGGPKLGKAPKPEAVTNGPNSARGRA